MAITSPPSSPEIDQTDYEIPNEHLDTTVNHRYNRFLNKLKRPFRIALIVAAGLIGSPASIQAQQNPSRIERGTWTKEELKFAKLVDGFNAALKAKKFQEASIFFDKMLSLKNIELVDPTFYTTGIISYQNTGRRNKRKIMPTCDRAILESNNQGKFRDAFLRLLNVCVEAVQTFDDAPRYATAALQYILFKHHLLTSSVDVQVLLRNIASNPDDSIKTIAILGRNPEYTDAFLTFCLQANPSLIDYRDPDVPGDISRIFFVLAKSLAEGWPDITFAWRYLNEKKIDPRWKEKWQRILRSLAPIFTKFEIQPQNRSTQDLLNRNAY